MFAIFCIFNISLAWQWSCGRSGEAKNNYCCARWWDAAGDLRGPYSRYLNVCKYTATLCVTKGVWERFMHMAVQRVIIYLAAKLGTCWFIKPGSLHNPWSLKLCPGYKTSRMCNTQLCSVFGSATPTFVDDLQKAIQSPANLTAALVCALLLLPISEKGCRMTTAIHLALRHCWEPERALSACCSYVLLHFLLAWVENWPLLWSESPGRGQNKERWTCVGLSF